MDITMKISFSPPDMTELEVQGAADAIRLSLIHILINYMLLFVIGIISYGLCEMLPGAGILNLILRIMVCLCLPNFLYYLTFRKSDEFKFVLEHFRVVLKR